MSRQAEVARTGSPGPRSETLRPAPSVFRLIAIPAAITLVVTLLRLLGELRASDATLSGSTHHGNGALLGIAWLVPVFGFWFGRRLVLSGAPAPSPTRAILLPLMGVVCVLALFLGATGFLASDLLTGKKTTLFVLSAAVPLCCSFAWAGWPELARVSLCYGLAARLPVVCVTVIAVARNWGTHYEVLGLPATDTARTLFLCGAQLLWCLPATMLIVAIAGGIAATVTRAWQI